MNSRSLFPSVRSLLAVLSLAVGLLGLTSQALASSSQESMFQDDRLLQNVDPAVQSKALDDLDAAGVTSIHTSFSGASSLRAPPRPPSRPAPRSPTRTPMTRRAGIASTASSRARRRAASRSS